MVSLMVRRGPDDEGLWSDHAHCAFGFRRLSIQDLSPAGHQPMLSADGRHVIVFNGEVYNFRELRAELQAQGIRFRSSGDTEVVLYALIRWGKQALERFNGMFALAFYDTLEKRLLLARDHAGIKPLYVLTTPEGLVFASQYDQILAHPMSRNSTVDGGALGLYLRLGYIPAPYALLQGSQMLPAGAWREIDAKGGMREGRHFNFPVYREPDLRGDDAVDALDEAITAAVKSHLVSDVPVGTFLSGGIDSPLVAAKIRSLGRGDVKAYTIGTAGHASDESVDASIYAREIGIAQVIEHIAPGTKPRPASRRRGSVRRALRRLFDLPHDAGVTPGPTRRHGHAVGRWRRRAVLGLCQALCGCHRTQPRFPPAPCLAATALGHEAIPRHWQWLFAAWLAHDRRLVPLQANAAARRLDAGGVPRRAIVAGRFQAVPVRRPRTIANRAVGALERIRRADEHDPAQGRSREHARIAGSARAVARSRRGGRGQPHRLANLPGPGNADGQTPLAPHPQSSRATSDAGQARLHRAHGRVVARSSARGVRRRSADAQ